jgi:hypothetical protein
MAKNSTPTNQIAAPRKPHGKFKMHRMEIEKAASGGFTAQHHFQPEETRMGEPGGYKPSETHVLPNIAALQKHVGQHFGGGTPAVPPAASADEAQEEVPAAPPE